MLTQGTVETKTLYINLYFTNYVYSSLFQLSVQYNNAELTNNSLR